MRPIIGVTATINTDEETLWIRREYFDAIEAAGGVPLLLPMTANAEVLDPIVGLCDAFLISGGQDIEPAVYGEEKLPCCAVCTPDRDDMELALLKRILPGTKPILGICRGLQMINCAFGGTLYQDLPTQHPSDVRHSNPRRFGEGDHIVTPLPETPLHALLGGAPVSFSSRHHQAVKKVGGGLVPMAVSPDGIVEALYLPGERFLWAVQWHPETTYAAEPAALAIFRALVEAVKKN